MAGFCLEAENKKEMIEPATLRLKLLCNILSGKKTYLVAKFEDFEDTL